MFSGVNNLTYLTILEKDLSTACGFTIDECKKILEDYQFSEEERTTAIDWYNGYIFGKTTILNPWSLINFVNQREFDSYWINTSSNDFLIDLIEKSEDLRDRFEIILRGEEVEVKVEKNITFKNNGIYEKDSVFSFLFFGGYLKCKEKYKKSISNREYLYCKMVPTNKECKMIFHDVIIKYTNGKLFNNRLRAILAPLIKGEIKAFEREFSFALRDIPSYHDTRSENSYHMFMLGMLVSLDEYEVISNKEAGYGRVDVILLHKEDKKKPAIVMELKIIDEFENEKKKKALKSAVKQIKEREYISYVKERGYKNIFAFGLVFDGKRCWIKEVE
jgi:DNA-binding transcriptional MerR regulator